jgi:tetratricopeptide (TPR) repeat protein
VYCPIVFDNRSVTAGASTRIILSASVSKRYARLISRLLSPVPRRLALVSCLSPLISAFLVALCLGGDHFPLSRAEPPWFAQCEALVKAGEYSRAQRLFMARVGKGASAASLYGRMGQLYFNVRQWSRARQFLQESLSFDPQNAKAHLLMGLADRQAGDQEGAKGELIEAARLAPQSDVESYFAGQQLLMMSEPAAALPFLYLAVKINPRSFDSLHALAMAQARLGNYGLAETYYRNALRLRALSPASESAAGADLAFLLLLGHNPQALREGLAWAQRAARQQPSSADAHYLTGKALMKLQRTREAVPELKAASKLSPNDIKAHFLLARAYERLGERQQAARERQLMARLRARPPRSGSAAGGQLP